MNSDSIIEVINEKNEKEKIQVLKYFTLKTNQKDYIIYKNSEIKTSADVFIFAAEIEETKDSICLKSIEDKESLDKIKEIMEELYNGRNC